MPELIVCTPMFLPNVAMRILDRAGMELIQSIDDAQVGDRVEAEYIGTAKDSDGWPMKRWRVHRVRGTE